MPCQRRGLYISEHQRMGSCGAVEGEVLSLVCQLKGDVKLSSHMAGT